MYNFHLTFLTNPGTTQVKSSENFKFFQDNVTYEYADNPAVSAGNNSCKVAKVTNHNAAAWDNLQFDFANKLIFTDGSNFTIKVYSPQSGYKVTLKLEDKANSGAFKQVASGVTTKTDEWEELTISFNAADSDKYDKVVFFFDLETKNGNTYYFDDLKLNLGTGGGGGGGSVDGDIASNGGFESGDLEGWTLYDNGGSATMDNTEAQTGDWCVKLFASAPSGLNPTLKQERKAAGSIVVGDKVQVTFSYKGSLTGESGTVSIQSFVEATNGASQIETFDVTPTNTWQTFTTTYTVTGALQGGDVSGGITMEFVAICGGVAGCSSTLYLDDISLIINP